MARVSPFPPYDLDGALQIARTILTQNAGKPMRRLTIFDALGKSPESSISRGLLTASSAYGLTEGSYAAEIIKLTDRGLAVARNNDRQARLDAILGVPIFAKFFDHYRNATVPSTSAAIDYLKGQGLNEQNVTACWEVLLKCGEQVGLIQEISSVRRVVSPDHALEKLTQLDSGVENIPALSTKPAPHDTEKLATQQKPSATGPAIPITMNIQIVIPSDASAEQYDSIFSNIKKYLIQPSQND